MIDSAVRMLIVVFYQNVDPLKERGLVYSLQKSNKIELPPVLLVYSEWVFM